jgi:hypothetical protein
MKMKIRWGLKRKVQENVKRKSKISDIKIITTKYDKVTMKNNMKIKV